jgi:pimeloyl-ACP methyl ester carboxylesterase
MIRIDRDFLAEHAGFRSEGIEERAFHMPSGDGWCLAMAYIPQEPRPPGFVMCHSYALEFTSLRRVERTVARGLARIGHPVLIFHHRGYGDSGGTLAEATLEGHLEDARTAADRLAEDTGVTATGVVGMRFGALIAGLLAREGSLDHLVLVNPVLHGGRYVRQMARQMQMVSLAGGKGGHRRDASELLTALREQGMAEMLGYGFYRGLFEPLMEVDLGRGLVAFRGSALIVEVSKRPTPSRELEALRATIEQGGGRCRLEMLLEPAGTQFGFVPFISLGDPSIREDVQSDMAAALAARIAAWVRA